MPTAPWRVLSIWILLLTTSFASSGQDEGPLRDKTLVVWLSPADLEQRGGTALTVNDTARDRFDGIVLGELEPGVWMAGSNGFSRTWREQAGWPRESVGPSEWVQVAIVYAGRRIRLLRDGEPYAEYETEGEPYAFGASTAILIGQRHLRDGVECLRGRVRDARVYARPLTREQIVALRPGEPLEGVAPWAWWDFAATGTYERTGRFGRVELSGGARLEDGCLVLEGEHPRLLATRVLDTGGAVELPTRWTRDEPVPDAVVRSTRLLRERLLEDPYRPGYHFCLPEDIGMPGDPNGAFHADGRYHLMYLYDRRGVGFSWGHVSSADLVHWRHHRDAIGPGDGDEGCFSGGAFVDDDGTAYLSYWMLWGAKGIGLARSLDRGFDRWEKLDANPVIRSTEWGITRTRDAAGRPLVHGSADPSNIWKKDGRYYVLTGNLPVLDAYGRGPDAPADMRGDRLYLLESTDLTDWAYRGVFYERRPEWTDDSEDNMCPSFLPLPRSPDGGAPSGKHLLAFISHNRGCQYYVGEYDAAGDRFLPERHGRMTWVDNTCFAPEALVDDRGRQILWAWLLDNPSGEAARGWSGVYALPRTVWLGEDGGLRMAPVQELEALRLRERSWSDLSLADGATRALEDVPGRSCELELVFEPIAQGRVGVKVLASPEDGTGTLVYYDARAHQLCMDTRAGSVDGRPALERAPLELPAGEPLRLRVFVDQSVVEVHANDRQAICRRAYPAHPDSDGIELFAEGIDAHLTRLRAWEMMPSNPY